MLAWGTFWLYDATFDAFISSGFDYFYYELLFGATVLAAPVVKTYCPFWGSALIASLLANVIIIMVGKEWNDISYYYALLPGLSYEISFILLYSRYGYQKSLFSGALLTTISTIIWDWSRNAYNRFSIPLLIILILLRFTSILLFSNLAIDFVNKLGGRYGHH